ncbi:MAG: DUF4838 domain-containing protein, partial [Candidatus Omnitrophica bacterium]|nr:DUF4838 domain-containing protein [Candidatus Omnitrophota bacterium]
CNAVEKMEIEIPSGFTKQMNEEGFISKTVGKDLILAGNEEWEYSGTMYAVYDFLEELGCRWFFPGEYGEVIPQKKTITIEERDRTERPSFRFRNLWYSGWFPVSATDSARLGEWYDRNKMAALKISLPGDGSVTQLAPPDKYFEDHPEIYALGKDGKRHKEMLCMTHPNSYKIAIETVKEAFRKDPDRISFAFAPPDGFPMCYCDTCQSYFPGFEGKGYGDPSLSDLWFQFANKIATEVYKEFPDRWIFTNGYANRVRPPEGVGKLSPNLGIQSAIIAACSIHKIGDPKCWQRLLYKQILDRWTKELNCVFIYDYDPGNSLVNLPFPALHNLRHDIPYFKDRGVWGFWTEGTNTWMVTHLNYYIRSKLEWDATEDVDALVRDYCEKFYEKAADPVEEYIWTLEDTIDSATVHETWGRLMPWRVILPSVIDKLDTLMESAEKAANNEKVKERVHVLRLTHDHMKLYLDMEESVAEGEFGKAVEDGEQMLTIRDEAEAIQTGLLPNSPDWVKNFRTSLEWHMTKYQGLADRIDGTSGELVSMLPREWSFKEDPEDVGTLYQWYNDPIDDSWRPLDTTLYWEAQGLQDEKGWGYWGKAWYALDFEVPADQPAENLWLTIGAVYNDGVWVWVNGERMNFKMDRHWRLGYHDVRTPIDIDISKVVHPGETNRLAVLVSTGMPGRNPRGGIHRRSFLWEAKAEPTGGSPDRADPAE